MKNFKLLLFFISLLFIFLIVGCSTTNPNLSTPTPVPTSTSAQGIISYLYLDSDDGIYGNVYIDGKLKGYLPPNGTLNLYNLQIGNHILTIDTLPNTSLTITILYNGQNIYINQAGSVWW